MAADPWDDILGTGATATAGDADPWDAILAEPDSQPPVNDSQIDSQAIHSDAAGFAMQPTPWAVSPGPVAERAPVVAGLPPTDPATYSAYQRREAGNRAGLAADAAAQQAIAKGVPYASRLLAGAAGAGAARINEAGGAWRDLISFYTGGEQTGQPANIINPRAVDELNAMGGTVGDTVGRGIIQNAPAAAELVPIDPVGMASMFLSHPLSKAIAGSAGFSAAKAQFLTELETVAGGRVAALTSNAIDDALGGAAFGGVNAGVRGEDPITGAIEGGAAGAALGGVVRGVVRGVGAVAGRMRGAPGEVAPPITDPRAVQSAVNEMRPGAVASPDARTTPPLETPAQSLRPAQSELPLRPGEVPQAVRGSIPQTGEQPASARPETSSLPSDRPSLEALAGRLGIPFTERTRTADLRAAVEAETSRLAGVGTPPPDAMRSSSSDQPSLPDRSGPEGTQAASSPIANPGVRDRSSLTPSPAEVEASQTTQSRLSQDPRYPRAQAGSDIRGIESTGESGISLAREQESGPREAPTPIRTGDTDRTTQTTSSRDSGIDSSPNPTPGEGGKPNRQGSLDSSTDLAPKQPWEMTQLEAIGPYQEPVTAEDIRRAEKTSSAARKKFERNTNRGGFVPPPIKAEIGGKIAAREASVADLREQYRAYVAEYRGKAEAHYEAVRQALRQGRPVPAEVLKDYPDLAAPAQETRVEGAAEVTPAESPRAAEEGQAAGGGSIDRAAVIEQIVDAARRPMDEIVPIVQLQGTDGKWYHANGFPVGVRHTGERRIVGYGFRGKDGVGYGKPEPTEAALIEKFNEAQRSRDDDLRTSLEERDDASLADAADYWLNRSPEARRKAAEAELAKPKPAKATKPTKPPRDLGTGSAEDNAKLAELRKRAKSGRSLSHGDELTLKLLEGYAKADPSKWAVGDGVGYRIYGQTNRGFRVKEVDPATKTVLLQQVADTGLTTSGGNYDRIQDQWVHVADLVRDRKYDKPTPPPPPTTGSFADRLEASARDKIKAIDADVAKKRRSLKKGQRLGVAPIFDYLVPYAQIALAKSIRAVNTTGEKVKVLRKYVREALKDSGIVDRKYENRVLTIARAMVKDATDPDGSLSQDRLYEVMDEAQQTFQRPTKGAETKRVIAENTQPQKQDKTITERQALRERFKAQRAAAPEIFKAGEVAGADKQEVKGRSQTIRAMLKMRRMGKAEGIAEGKARLESTLDSIRLARGNVESLQKEAAAAVKRMIPKAQRGDWYTQIRDTKTPAALAQVLNGVKVERARIDGTHDAKWISTEARDANLVRAFGAKSQELQAVRSIVRDAEAYLRDLDSKDMDTVLAAQEDLATAKYEITAALKQAKEENTAKLKGTRLAAAQARAETIDAIKKARPTLPEKGEISGSKEAPMMRRWVRKMYTPATLARSLDGGWKTDGPVTRTFKALDGGMEQKHQLRRTYQEGMNALAQKYGYRDVGDALGKISGTLGRQTQETIPVVVGGKRLTKGQALYIAIMDPKAKSHASAGGEFVWDNARDAPKFKLTDGIRSKIYDALPAKDLAMVGEMKRLYNETYFDAVDRVSLRLNGSHLIRQPDYMRIRRYAPGGEGAGEPRAMRQISRRHLEDAGFLKPRTGGKSPIVLGDAMLELLSMGEAASNVAGLAEPARFAEMVLLHGDVRTQIRDVAGDSAVKRVEQIIYGLADQRDTMDTAQKIGREVISNVAASKTTLNWKTWLRQVGGVFPLWTGMEGKYWAKGLKAALDTGMEKDLEGRSGWFWNRWNGGPYSAYVGIQAIPLGADVPGSAFKDAGKATLKQLKMAALQAGRLQMGEAGADIGGAYKAFKQLRSSITVGNWFDSIPARVAYAGKLAEAKDLHPDWSLDRQKNWAAKESADLFKSTQNTSDWMNASGWQQDASKNAALSPFLTFQSQPAKMTNLAITAFRQGGAARAKFIGAVVMSAAWSAAITGGAMVGRDALNRALHGERLNPKDADDAFNYAKWQFGSDVLGIVPGMGTGINLLRRAISGGYGQSSMDTLVGDVIRSFEEGVGGLVDAIGRLDDPINPYTGRPVKNKRMLTAQEKFLRSLDAIQSSARSAAGDPTVPLTNDLSRVIQTKR